MIHGYLQMEIHRYDGVCLMEMSGLRFEGAIPRVNEVFRWPWWASGRRKEAFPKEPDNWDGSVVKEVEWYGDANVVIRLSPDGLDEHGEPEFDSRDLLAEALIEWDLNGWIEIERVGPGKSLSHIINFRASQ